MEKDFLLSEFMIKKVLRRHRYTLDGEVSYSHPKLAYIKQGRAEFLYNGRTLHAKAGDMVYIPMNTLYYSVWFGEPQIEFYVIEFSFYSPHIFYEYNLQVVSGYSGDVFDKIYSEAGKSDLMALSRFYGVLSIIYDKMTVKRQTHKSSYIQPALEYIESNFSQPIEIKALAQLCSCSESSLFKAFQAVMGVSPIAYKHNIMIQNALDMLAHTDLSIEEISRRVGFASANYFRKIFIKITGKTPKEIRRKN